MPVQTAKERQKQLENQIQSIEDGTQGARPRPERPKPEDRTMSNDSIQAVFDRLRKEKK